VLQRHRLACSRAGPRALWCVDFSSFLENRGNRVHDVAHDMSDGEKAAMQQVRIRSRATTGGEKRQGKRHSIPACLQPESTEETLRLVEQSDRERKTEARWLVSCVSALMLSRNLEVSKVAKKLPPRRHLVRKVSENRPCVLFETTIPRMESNPGRFYFITNSRRQFARARALPARPRAAPVVQSRRCYRLGN